MNKPIINIIIYAFLVISFTKVSSQSLSEIWENDHRAIIVVTGMQINTDNGAYYLEDSTVAEGALVEVTERNGRKWQKETQAFHQTFEGRGTLYTADFPITMDLVYTITITFRSGAIITIDDFKIPGSWKRHHYFHLTDGTKTPASVLRKKQHDETGLWCYVYSLYPLSNYKELGGNQVK
jgi:hypothetical protein